MYRIIVDVLEANFSWRFSTRSKNLLVDGRGILGNLINLKLGALVNSKRTLLPNVFLCLISLLACAWRMWTPKMRPIVVESCITTHPVWRAPLLVVADVWARECSGERVLFWPLLKVSELLLLLLYGVRRVRYIFKLILITGWGGGLRFQPTILTQAEAQQKPWFCAFMIPFVLVMFASKGFLQGCMWSHFLFASLTSFPFVLGTWTSSAFVENAHWSTPKCVNGSPFMRMSSEHGQPIQGALIEKHALFVRYETFWRFFSWSTSFKTWGMKKNHRYVHLPCWILSYVSIMSD